MFRVVINWSYSGLSFVTERGVLANSPGMALDLALASIRAERASRWRAFVEEAPHLDAFSHEASILPVVNGRGETVADFYQR